MTITVVRAWLAFAAIGGGIIHLAVVVGSPLPLAAVAVVVGALELAWGLGVLARAAPPVPRVALVVAGAAALGSALGSALPLALAALLDALVVALLVLERRTSASGTRAPKPAPETSRPPDTVGRIARSLLAIAAGAVLVGAVTAPALAATEAGRHARPHGAHVVEPAPPVAPEGHAGH